MSKIPFKEYLTDRFKDKKFLIAVCVFVTALLFSTVWWCVFLNVRNAVMSVFYIALVPLILIVEYLLGIRCGILFVAGIMSLTLGGILGTCFNFYTLIPFFDTILHGLSGVLFCCVGFTLAEKFFGKADSGRRFFGCLVFSICFSLAIAVFWEIFEYACTALGFDMMEDTFVTNINSYILAGSHSETVRIDDIVKTVIHYGDGLTYTVNGYLDLGIIDTMTDLIICTAGTLIFALLTTFGYFKAPKINRALIPQAYENKTKGTEYHTEL